MLCRAHIQADALNRQALVSVVYIRELGIDGYCPKCILLLLTVLLPEIVCQIRSLLEDSWGTERSEEERLREDRWGAEWWRCHLMRVHLAWDLGGRALQLWGFGESWGWRKKRSDINVQPNLQNGLSCVLTCLGNGLKKNINDFILPVLQYSKINNIPFPASTYRSNSFEQLHRVRKSGQPGLPNYFLLVGQRALSSLSLVLVLHWKS